MEQDQDAYYVAIVQRDRQWFEGPFADADVAERAARLFRIHYDHTNARVIGVR